MYSVRVYTLTVPESITYPTTELVGGEWTTLATICQLETDDAELEEARELMAIAKRFYAKVQIVKSLSFGLPFHVEGDRS